MRILRGEPLHARTTLGVGGATRLLAEPSDLCDLQRTLSWVDRHDLPSFCLGGGTNLLCSDETFPGLVIATHRMDRLEPTGSCRMRVQGGTPLRRVIKASLRWGWKGLETFVGIPGSIGGAVYGNAGPGPAGIQSHVESVLVVRRGGDVERLHHDEIDWRYRGSDIGAGAIAEVVLRFEPGDRVRLRREAQEVMNRKVRTQPLHAASAGCVFRNPPGAKSAGRLIDESGLKGLRLGGAKVSERHANFIVNEGGATAVEVEELIDQVRTRVQMDHGVELESEIVRFSAVGAAAGGRS